MIGTSKAELEFHRTRRAVAWMPVAHVMRKDRNQYWSCYTFSDGSRLEMWANGRAAWADDVRSQRGAADNHHMCNRFGM